MERTFQRELNYPPSVDPLELEAGSSLNIRTSKITKTEVLKAIQNLQTGKDGGIDYIPPEEMKALDDVSITCIHKLLNKIWQSGKKPDDWRQEFLVKIPKKGDKSQYNNWKGNNLSSIQSKILCSIVLLRMKHDIDKLLRKKQGG